MVWTPPDPHDTSWPTWLRTPLRVRVHDHEFSLLQRSSPRAVELRSKKGGNFQRGETSHFCEHRSTYSTCSGLVKINNKKFHLPHAVEVAMAAFIDSIVNNQMGILWKQCGV
eukprot:CAMPEP_0171568682 /NCGR_PEP_ID=MMETSP0961-20121227/1904_1 /TAXON_ID=87120 /ORGANISM="Aurantiochytrium limacinum, Strain ATCCMYA-1381" /LENGTH=111 /DNA_ID=CAMNT_0012122847 /DNA_START=193 /DNA_END=524 /DNA_ORIENTATION=+